jgi:hypothetical protein
LAHGAALTEPESGQGRQATPGGMQGPASGEGSVLAEACEGRSIHRGVSFVERR